MRVKLPLLIGLIGSMMLSAAPAEARDRATAEALQGELAECWQDQAAGRGLDRSDQITVRLRLDREGQLTAPPELIETCPADRLDPGKAAARDSLAACAPFDLPSETHASWREMVVVFGPPPRYAARMPRVN